MFNFTIPRANMSARLFEFVGAVLVKSEAQKKTREPQDAAVLRAKKRHPNLITINILRACGAQKTRANI